MNLTNCSNLCWEILKIWASSPQDEAGCKVPLRIEVQATLSDETDTSKCFVPLKIKDYLTVATFTIHSSPLTCHPNCWRSSWSWLDWTASVPLCSPCPPRNPCWLVRLAGAICHCNRRSVRSGDGAVRRHWSICRSYRLMGCSLGKIIGHELSSYNATSV